MVGRQIGEYGDIRCQRAGEFGLVAGQLKDNNLTQVLFNLPPGDWEAGERGIASLPGREREFSESVAKAISYARSLNLSRLHCMAGLSDPSVAGREQRDTYVQNLRHAGEQCRDNGIQLLIEPINRKTHSESLLLF